jgi:cyclophilin family peptidyl-prolyl cis-trans isomerase
MKKVLLALLILSACGKGNKNEINQFADDKLIQIFELQDRRETDSLIPLLKAKKESHRIAAALAFASAQDTLAIPYLSQMLQIDQDELPRRAAAFALGQIGHSKSLQILRSSFDSELSNVNRRYILEAIGKCGDTSTLDLFNKVNYQDSILSIGWAYGVFRLAQKGLYADSLTDRMIELLEGDNSQEEKQLAAHYLHRCFRKYPENSTERITALYANQTAEIKARLDQFLNSAKAEREQIGWDWTVEYSKLNPYKKAAKIANLDVSNPKVIEWCVYEIMQVDSNPKVVKNAALEKYIEARTATPSNNWPHTMRDVLTYALNSGDMAMQSIAAIELQKTTYSEEGAYWLPLLTKIRSELVLPEKAETFIDVSKATEALGGEKFAGYKPKYNHPINWEFVKTIPHNQQVLITTNKGEVRLLLFVNDAPGTVANFLKLTDSGFYDGKYFHRVVLQFVIQGGCPRGDGWGGKNWTQRSEFSNYQTYETGTVGIASAGNDTEGVQFFVTHCPTPHLDGRYTIFARVIDGMEVVNKIEVGDKIISIKRAASKVVDL